MPVACFLVYLVVVLLFTLLPPCQCCTWQAEFLLRGMRKWDEDGIPDPQTTAFGEVRLLL